MTTQTDMPKISIIVTNFKNSNLLAKCLETIFKSNYPRSKFEVVVVDCLTSQKDLEMIKKSFPDVKIVHFDMDIGASASHNVGAKHSSKESRYLVFLDNDVLLDPFCLSELLSNMRARNVGAVQAKILNLDKTVQYIACLIDDLGFIYSINSEKKLRKVVAEGHVINGLGSTCCCVRKDLYFEIKGFDPIFWVYHDDQDLGLRVVSMGFQISIACKAIAYHIGGASTSERGLFFSTRNKYIIIFKNYPDLCCLRALLCQLIYDFKTILRCVRKKKINLALIVCSALYWVIKNLKLLHLIRKGNKSIAKNIRLNKGSPKMLLPAKLLRQLH
jgi:GT2 family glycosyltransferase